MGLSLVMHVILDMHALPPTVHRIASFRSASRNFFVLGQKMGEGNGVGIQIGLLPLYSCYR